MSSTVAAPRSSRKPETPDVHQLEAEDLVAFTDINSALPHPVPKGTADRWVRTGIAGRRLETFNLGGRRYTSRQAIRRFLRHCNGG